MATIYPPGKLERAARAFAYGFTALIGLDVLLDPPASGVESALGSGLTVLWAAFILSSVFCIPGAVMGRYRVEYVLIPLFTSALVVAVLAVWFMASAGDHFYTVPRAAMASALVFCFIARWAALHKIIKTLESLAERAGTPWTRPQSR